MIQFGTAAPTGNGSWDGEEYLVTSDGTSTGTVTAQYVWDHQSEVWVLRPAAPEHQFQTGTATAGMTTITLAKTPILGTTGKVRVSRNGVDVTRAFTWVGAVGTYNSANNYACTWDAGDVWQAEYEAL